MKKTINTGNILTTAALYIVEIFAEEAIKSFFKPKKKEWWEIWKK